MTKRKTKRALSLALTLALLLGLLPAAALAGGDPPSDGKTWTFKSEQELEAGYDQTQDGDTILLDYSGIQVEILYGVKDSAFRNRNLVVLGSDYPMKLITNLLYPNRLEIRSGIMLLLGDLATVPDFILSGGELRKDPDNAGNIYISGTFDYRGGVISNVMILPQGPDGSFVNNSGGDVRVNFNRTDMTVPAGGSVDSNGTMTAPPTGDFTVDGLTITTTGGDPVRRDAGGQILLDDGTYTVFGTWSGTPTADQSALKVPAGKTANLTLAGVNIDVSGTNKSCAFDMRGATVELTLAEGTHNLLKSGDNRAGLEAREGSTLTIGGTGRLEAAGKGGGAGIGGDGGISGSAGGSITIGGSAAVKATGGGSGAGIGGGGGDVDGGDGGTIKIVDSAAVIAESVTGAGVGGGGGDRIGGGSGGDITIGGSAKVEAVSVTGAGIGGGGNSSGSNGGDGGGGTIKIVDSAAVIAESVTGAGIGGGGGDGSGGGGDGGDITVGDNAVVFAESSGGADHIGGGANTSGGVGDSSGVQKTGGVIFEGAAGAVYGSVTLPGDLTIPDGFTLTIPDGKNLTNDHTLQNGGTIDGTGILTGSGVFTGNGTYTLKVTRVIAPPTAASVTKTSVTLNAASPKGDGAVEYAKSGTGDAPADGWQATPAFDGLTAGTTYYFFARVTGGKICMDAFSDGAAIRTAVSGGSSGPSYYSRTLADKASGVKVEGRSIHENARLTVEAGALHQAGDAGCALLRAAQASGHLLGAWDVSLSRSFRGSVTVSLPVEGRNGSTLTVAYCADGKLILSNVKASGGFAAVEADVLSPFAVLDGAYTLAELQALTQPAWENPFADVDESDWFYEAVACVHQKGLMAGTADTAFGPGGAVTRAQVWTVLARLDGADTSGGAPWYAPAQSWAVAKGVSDGTDPDGPVTREQLVAMLYRYAQNAGMDVSAGGDTNILSYDDAFDVAEWAVPAFQWACGAGVVSGTSDTTLSPQTGTTRAQLAAVLMRMTEK